MIAAAFVANAIVFGFAAPANAQTKIALVFGNGAYPLATGPSQQHVQHVRCAPKATDDGLRTCR